HLQSFRVVEFASACRDRRESRRGFLRAPGVAALLCRWRAQRAWLQLERALAEGRWQERRRAASRDGHGRDRPRSAAQLRDRGLLRHRQRIRRFLRSDARVFGWHRRALSHRRGELRHRRGAGAVPIGAQPAFSFIYLHAVLMRRRVGTILALILLLLPIVVGLVLLYTPAGV